jgi:hypothetical protein
LFKCWKTAADVADELKKDPFFSLILHDCIESNEFNIPSDTYARYALHPTELLSKPLY